MKSSPVPTAQLEALEALEALEWTEVLFFAPVRHCSLTPMHLRYEVTI